MIIYNINKNPNFLFYKTYNKLLLINKIFLLKQTFFNFINHGFFAIFNITRFFSNNSPFYNFFYYNKSRKPLFIAVFIQTTTNKFFF